MWRSPQRYSRRRCRALLRIFILSFLLFNFYDILLVRRNLSAAQRVGSLKLRSSPRLGNERYFISSIHWNSEVVLRNGWATAMIELIEVLGADKVYVSLYESGSWDNTKAVLKTLDLALDQMKVQRSIVLDDTTHNDELQSPSVDDGWVTTPQGASGIRRIPYLSRLRNLSLKPLEELEINSGQRFDKVLMLNDVEDILVLLDTNGGEYAAACSLDFSNPTNVYDTFALRDSEGHEHLTQTWPYFRARKSRKAVKVGAAVPVTSCWNGMVAMNAEPFYDNTSISNASSPPSSLSANIPPLRFRSIPDSLAQSHLEGSECCLIHADNPLSRSKGVWLNPNVRVAYNAMVYDHIKNPQQFSAFKFLGLLWKNRLQRWLTTPRLKSFVVNRRFRKWQARYPGIKESGSFCLINEMQILAHNGWAHV